MAKTDLRVNDPMYQQRREEVLNRDDHTCVHCGFTRGEGTKRIEVHPDSGEVPDRERFMRVQKAKDTLVDS